MTIVAECGLNHNGDMELAKRMISLAKINGSDLVKFQLYDSDKIPSIDWHRKAELSFEQAKMLFDYGASVGIEVFFSVFDVERVRWCEEIGVKRYKIAYSQQNNRELINLITEYDAPLGSLIISTDNTRLWGDVKFLYCVPLYPTPLECINFYKMDDFDGFSDHTIGLDASKIALARGAEIIEKHFTLDKNMEGPDHKLSMTPGELRELVRWQKVCQQVL